MPKRSRPTVLCTLPLPDPFAELVSPHANITVLGEIPDEEHLLKAIADTRPAVLCPQLRDSVSRTVLEKAQPVLKGVATYSVGVNHIDLSYCNEAKIVVANTPDVLTDATADLTFALILAVTRRIVEGDGIMRNNAFPGWSPTYHLGKDLAGSTLGIIGFGRIGRAVAHRGIAFGMQIATVERPTPPEGDAGLFSVVRQLPLEKLLAESDVVSLHCPLTDETRHLINATTLQLMKKDAVLINTSRGAVIDEEALAAALNAGTIWGAGLDVYEKEPLASEAILHARNTVLAPHIGSATEQTRSRMAHICALNVVSILNNERPRCAV